MYLTIAIAVYNGEHYLEQMVDSVLGQTFWNFELLLLDDGSADGSSALCDSFARKDDRVRVTHKSNAGLCACRNLAIETARGSHICFLDQDDRLLPGMLQAHVDALELRPADFSVGGYSIRVENASGEMLEQRHVFAPDEWLGSSAMVRRFYLDHLDDGVAAPVWNMVYSLGFLRKNLLRFDESLRMSLDDLAFHTQAFFRAECVQVLSNIGNEYYVRSVSSSSRKYNEGFLSQCSIVLARLYDQLVAAGMESQSELSRYYRLVFRLFVISGLQNLVYARKMLGKQQVLLGIRKLCCDSVTESAVLGLVSESGLSRYEQIILHGVRRLQSRALYTIIALKDCLRASRLFLAAKRVGS